MISANSATKISSKSVSPTRSLTSSPQSFSSITNYNSTTVPLTVTTTVSSNNTNQSSIESPNNINITTMSNNLSTSSSSTLLTTTSTASSSSPSSSSNSSLSPSTAYALLNALISILSDAKTISNKHQQQIENFVSYWKNIDLKAIQVNYYSC